MLSKYVIKLLGPNPTWPAFNKYMIKIKIICTNVFQLAKLSPFSDIKLINNCKWHTCTHTQLFQTMCPTFTQKKDLCK